MNTAFSNTQVASARAAQFRIGTLLIWTAVAGFSLALFRDTLVNLDVNSVSSAVFIWTIAFAPPLLCIPNLFERLVYPHESGLVFRRHQCVHLFVGVGIYSVVMLMFATVGFEPDWKGSKGHHWIYYINDAPSGFVTWPIYFLGVLSFLTSVVSPRYAQRSSMNRIMIGTTAIISAWYAFACVCLNFSVWDRLAARRSHSRLFLDRSRFATHFIVACCGSTVIVNSRWRRTG